ncbi:tyrosine-protein phosphatase [Microbacterium sp. LjRoot45]|uniref:tyrosine-protein phosphatase n=1 Tax=Microbacterium sp. LjRoot45 TaxID=3342329 RepID=UPI003ED11EB3
MADVAGALNFRDVGGLPAGSGVTRHGVLFRSGNLARVGEEGRAALRSLGLRHIVDLREDAEIAYEPTDLGDLPVVTRRVPLFAGSASSFFEEDVTLADLYRTLVDGSSEAIVQIVRGVVDDAPLLVHCTVGKDRTGVAVALTLAAAGVDEDAIVADYARTETLLPADRNARVLSYLQRLHPEARNLADLATRSPAPVMRGLLDDLRARFGAPVEFLRARGLSDDDVRELRRSLITD